MMGSGGNMARDSLPARSIHCCNALIMPSAQQYAEICRYVLFCNSLTPSPHPTPQSRLVVRFPTLRPAPAYFPALRSPSSTRSCILHYSDAWATQPQPCRHRVHLLTEPSDPRVRALRLAARLKTSSNTTTSPIPLSTSSLTSAVKLPLFASCHVIHTKIK